MSATNAIRRAHDALADQLSAAFDEVDGLTLARNPSGHTPPKARAEKGGSPAGPMSETA
ncbi:hypothetical protein [Phenylobacterium sp.]|uniref:hypothetical protein n=1 Tax=Phenylobacterium sp. TaxID=1871053 RepID=UPI004035D16A